MGVRRDRLDLFINPNSRVCRKDPRQPVSAASGHPSWKSNLARSALVLAAFVPTGILPPPYHLGNL